MPEVDVHARGTPSYTVTVALGLLAFYAVFVVSNTIYVAFFGPLSKFPGPKIRAISIIPHVWAVMSGEHHRSIVKLHQKYGPVVRVAPKYIVYASGQQAWKDIYGFRKGGIIPKDRDFYTQGPQIVENIIDARTDEEHGRQRKILSHAFSDKALKEQEPLIKTWSAKLSSKLAERADAHTKTDMLKMYNCTTFDIMGDLTFGEGLNMLDDSEYSPWVKMIFDNIKFAIILQGVRLLGGGIKWSIDNLLLNSKTVEKARWEHAKFSADRVDRRLARQTTRPDLWTIILRKKEEDGGLTLAQQHANGNLFMIAGTETTATALSGTTYYLLRNPKILAKLTAEIRSEVNTMEDLTLERLARMKYLQATLQEGLRMYPPVPIELPRLVAKGGVWVDGYFLPEGTKVGANHFSTYRREEHFRKANEFHPERWLGDAEFKDDHLSAVENFSVGPRNCIGKNLAWHEMRILLVTVLSAFDLKLLPDSNDWDNQKVYTLWEKKPLWCTLTKANART